MTQDTLQERRVTLASKSGLHARPAARLAEAAAALEVLVSSELDDQ